MQTPPITVRLPEEHHELIRNIARSLKADLTFADDLRKLIGEGIAVSGGATDLLATLERQCRSLVHRVDLLEEAASAVPILNQVSSQQGRGVSAIALEPATTMPGATIDCVKASDCETNRPRSAVRRFADALVRIDDIPDGQGGYRCLKRAEIEAALIVQFRISRDAAQSAATKAVAALSEEERAKRRSREPPNVRKVNDAQAKTMTALRDKGTPTADIARQFNVCARTVRTHVAQWRAAASTARGAGEAGLHHDHLHCDGREEEDHDEKAVGLSISAPRPESRESRATMTDAVPRTMDRSSSGIDPNAKELEAGVKDTDAPGRCG